MANTAHTNTTRYDRQTILPEIGLIGQKKLSNTSVLCVGAGGLGCPALLYLAGAGIGHISIIDHDLVTAHNLHRQILYTMNDIGRPKADCAQKHLTALNPDIRITAHPEKLTADNIERIIPNYDIIIDGTDNFTGQFLLSDAAVKYKKIHIYGAIRGFEGQLAVFDHTQGTSPCYRCLFPHPPQYNVPNCAEAGVIGAAAGIIGTMQAMEAIKCALNHENLHPLTGKILCLDTRTMTTRTLTIPKTPDCPACHAPENIIFTEDEPMNIKEQTAQDVYERLQNGENFHLLDVREQDEWDAGHIDQAILHPLSHLLEGNTITLPKNDPIVIYCRSGQRSLHAAQMFMAQGYTDLTNMAGGYLAWQDIIKAV